MLSRKGKHTYLHLFPSQVDNRPEGSWTVLDAYIIDDIKKREDERRRQEDLDRPRLHIEIDDPRRHEEEIRRDDFDEPEEEEGIIRIDL